MITIKTFEKTALTLGLLGMGWLGGWYFAKDSAPSNPNSVYIEQTAKNIYALSKDPASCCIDTLATAPTTYFTKGVKPCPPDSSDYWKGMYESLLPKNNTTPDNGSTRGDGCRPITD